MLNLAGGTDRRPDAGWRGIARGDRVALVRGSGRGSRRDRPAAGGHPRRVEPAAGNGVTSCSLSGTDPLGQSQACLPLGWAATRIEMPAPGGSPARTWRRSPG